MNTETTGLEPDDNLDFELDLDESLFEHKSPKNRAKSEGQLNIENFTQQGGGKQILPQRYRRSSSQSQDTQQQNRPEGSTKIPMIEREHRSYGDLPIRQNSRRTSTTSDHSDFSSDFQPSEGTRSQNSSSFFKSVRFDIEDISSPDSGVVTGTSTPYYPERRASEPECKAARQQERRASAPECTTPESVSDEGSGNGIHGDSSDREESKDKLLNSSEFQQPEVHLPPPNSAKGDRRTIQEEASVDAQEIKSRSTQPLPDLDSETPLHEDTERDISLPSAQPRKLKMPAHVTQPEPPPIAPQTKVKVAHLIEHWRDTTTETAAQAQKEVPKPVKGASQNITKMMQRYQQQTAVATEPNSQILQEDYSRERRPSKHLSKLVTDTTKQLLEPPVRTSEKVEQGPKPQKLTVQWPKSEEMEIGESPGSSASSILLASVPQFDLTDIKQTRKNRKNVRNQENSSDSHSEVEPDDTSDRSKLQYTINSPPTTTGNNSKLPHPVDPYDSPHNDRADDNLYHDEEDPLVEEDVPWFERPPTIPVFTTPFANNWQPSHLRTNRTQNLSSFWSFTGQANAATEESERLLFEGDDSNSDEDEDMLQPLSSSVGFPSISPIGKTLFSSRSQSSPTFGFQMAAGRDVKKPPMPFSEAFARPPFQQRLANRLSAIPEESPELTRSGKSSIVNIVMGSGK